MVLLYSVVVSNKKSKTKNIFILLLSSVIVWQLTEFLMQHASNSDSIDLLLKLNYIGVIFMPVLFYHFSSIFHHFNKIILCAVYFVGLMFQILLWTSDNFIVGFHQYSWGIHPAGGLIHTLFVLFTFFVIFLIPFALHRAWHKEFILEKRKQIRLLFISIGVFSLAVVDFIPNYGVDLYPFGSIFILGFLGLIFYITHKYKIMSAKSFNDRIFVISVLTISSYLFWFVVFWVEKVHFGQNFMEKSSMVNMILLPFFIFFFIESYKRISFFSQKIFKTFDRKGHLINFFLEIPSGNREVSIYLQNKFSIIFGAKTYVFCKEKGVVSVFFGDDEKESSVVKNMNNNKEYLWDNFIQRGKFTILKEQKLKSVIPNSHRYNFINVLDKYKIEVFVPIKNKEIFILMEGKNNGARYSYKEIKFLTEISENV